MKSKEQFDRRLFGSQILDLIGNGNPGYNADFSIFENIRHGYFVIKTRDYGYVAMIPVGLETIGSVVFEDSVKNIAAGQEVTVTKGEKLEYFAHGGSMVMLLFEKNRMKK